MNTSRTRRFRVRFPEGARDHSLLHNKQTGSGAHTVSYSVGTRVLLRGVTRLTRGVANLHLAQRLIMSCAFLVWAGTPLPLLSSANYDPTNAPYDGQWAR